MLPDRVRSALLGASGPGTVRRAKSSVPARRPSPRAVGSLPALPTDKQLSSKSLDTVLMRSSCLALLLLSDSLSYSHLVVTTGQTRGP